MLRWIRLGVFVAGLLGCVAASAEPPRSIAELFAGIDPARDDLDTRLVREWESDGVLLRYVTYHVDTFLGQPARIAAFYGFPRGGAALPGLLHLHGGGQRASINEVSYYARRGYACLSINWGGRPMEEARDEDPNTDWGAVDPTQGNVPGYFNLRPGPGCLDAEVSPRNNNWYLLTLGARRGLTFLERQPEVDPAKLGVYGHSMGGNLTVYVAGSDDRVRVAAPSVGGQGFRTLPWEYLPQQRKQTPNADADLFRSTLAFQAYAPRIKAPLLWLGASNDFHGIMDDTYRTGALIPHPHVRYVFTPHMNHRFTPEFAVARPLWLDQHLRGGFSLPETPASRILLQTEDHVPRLEVRPDLSREVDRVHVLYSVDPDPQARFWRSAEATRSGDAWTASLPLLSIDTPFFAYANVHYLLDRAEQPPASPPTSTLAISSRFHAVSPGRLREAKVQATDRPTRLIDDFSGGWRDWYLLSPSNPHHWEYSTRKISDPKWRGGEGDILRIEVQSQRPNSLVIVATENFFRSYRGPQRQWTSVVSLPGGKSFQTVRLKPGDLVAGDREDALESWQDLDVLSFRAYWEEDGRLLGDKQWAGDPPRFRRLSWEGESANGPRQEPLPLPPPARQSGAG